MNEAVVTEKKHWSASRTIQFNALVAALVAIEANLNLLQPYLPGNFYAYVSMGLVVGNTFLRTITSTALTTQKADQAQ
jgi:hypothetical protein